MNASVNAVLQVLESAGFQRLPKPLVVAGAAFDFDAAVTGTGPSHDLVVISGSDADHDRLPQLLSGLSRRLDRVESRRPVSVVLLGPRPTGDVLARLEVNARVLVLEGVEPSVSDIEDSIAVLLPLQIPPTSGTTVAPLDELAARLGQGLTPDHQMLMDAAPAGTAAVQDALRKFIDEVFDEVAKKGDR